MNVKDSKPLSLREAVISGKKTLRRSHSASKKRIEMTRCVNLIGNPHLRDVVAHSLAADTKAAQIAWAAYRAIEDEGERRELWLERASDIELVTLSKQALEEICKALEEVSK